MHARVRSDTVHLKSSYGMLLARRVGVSSPERGNEKTFMDAFVADSGEGEASSSKKAKLAGLSKHTTRLMPFFRRGLTQRTQGPRTGRGHDRPDGDHVHHHKEAPGLGA